MCCGLRLHVIIISVFGIMFSGFLHFTWNFKPYQSHLISNKDTKKANLSDTDVAVLLRCLKYLEYMNLFSNICSLIGAFRYKKYLLIPYMVINLIWILLVLISALLLIVLGLNFNEDELIQSLDEPEYLGRYLTVLAPLAMSLGIYLYGFVIVVLFYREISSGNAQCRNTVTASHLQTTQRQPDQPIQTITPFGMTNDFFNEPERTQVAVRQMPPSYANEPPPPYSYERQPPKNPYM